MHGSFQHLFHRGLKLLVLAPEDGSRVVVHLDVRLDLHVLKPSSLFCAERADLRDSKHHAIQLCLPPNGRHRARHRHTDQLADSQSPVGVWETAGIGVVVLAHKHARRLPPLVVRVAADVLSSWSVSYIFLAAQESGEVIVQPAASVVPCVHDGGVSGPVLAEEF